MLCFIRSSRFLLQTALFFFLPFLCIAQNFGFDFENKKQKKVYLPFELYNNLIIVPVKLNNRLPLKFILDTGIRTTILTEKIMSDALGLTFNRRIVLKGPGEQQFVAAHVASNVNITMPGIVGSGQALLVLEQDYLQLPNYLGAEVHGIIGYELFSRFIVEVDYKNHMLILQRGNFYKVKRKYKRIPMEIEDTKPYVNATIVLANGDTIHSRMMIDTGASHALLIEENEEKNIVAPAENIESDIGRGLGGTIKGKLGRIKSVQLDDFVLKDVIASFPNEGEYIDTIFFNRTGTIGGELLSRFYVVFNYSDEALYLKKNSSFKSGFEYDMSGIEVMAVGPKLRTFEVVKVRPDTPACHAGLLPGDTIVYLNGIKAENLKLNQIYRLFHSKPGRKIRMYVRHNGEERKVVFTLKKFI